MNLVNVRNEAKPSRVQGQWLAGLGFVLFSRVVNTGSNILVFLFSTTMYFFMTNLDRIILKSNDI